MKKPVKKPLLMPYYATQTMLSSLELCQKLIQCPSITPDDAGCQELLAKLLEEAGFTIRHLPFGDTHNLWAFHKPNASTHYTLCCVGHTDVVPPGPGWTHPPFDGINDGHCLWGRGAQDMKGALAAMVIAAIRFVSDYPNHTQGLAFLMTSDEEGSGRYGTKEALKTLMSEQEHISGCLVGEPSAIAQVGDSIKIGRRGSLSANITLYGQQGHVAYAENALNPIHQAASLLKKLSVMDWDEEQNSHPFPPSQGQIVSIHAGDPSCSNVIPGSLNFFYNIRYNTLHTAEKLQARLHALIEKEHEHYAIDWILSASPFYSPAGPLRQTLLQAIKNTTGLDTLLSTAGGTSDGRFFAPLGIEVIECGSTNSNIHQVNEKIALSEIKTLEEIYYQTFKTLL
jgi:succinyl-diaminopimelate desuccinylase